MFDNNKVTLHGEIVSNFEFSHEVLGEGFYITMLSIKRLSNTNDILPIMVSDRLIDISSNWIGRFVKVSGQFRSYNRHEESKSTLILSVFAREFEETGEIPFINNTNSVFMDGYICKKPVYRKTPLGREVTDIILAVNRPYGKSDYIPCIAWGRNARFSDSLEVGSHIQLWGRIQSREYQKKISDEEYETKIAYEISVQRMEVVENEQSED